MNYTFLVELRKENQNTILERNGKAALAVLFLLVSCYKDIIKKLEKINIRIAFIKLDYYIEETLYILDSDK